MNQQKETVSAPDNVIASHDLVIDFRRVYVVEAGNA